MARKKAELAPDKLTPKQEAFALAFFETGNAAEAYRRAYDVGENAKDSWIYVEACQLLDNPKITLRLNELQAQAAKLSIFSRQKALEEYEAARKLAMSIEAPSAAVAAINGKAKLFGLETPAKQKLEVTGKDGGPIQTEVRAADLVKARLDEIRSRTTGGAAEG